MYAIESDPAPANTTFVAVGIGLIPFDDEVVSFATQIGAVW